MFSGNQCLAVVDLDVLDLRDVASKRCLHRIHLLHRRLKHINEEKEVFDRQTCFMVSTLETIFE